MGQSVIRDIFILSALLIVAAYFAGLSTDINAASAGLSNFIMAVTGRNPANGNFAGYPGNAPASITTFPIA